ncbi:transglycosylase SLT domain-containing protein [Streptomyces sp. RB6PN25]|uniref:Transglycosylase SLT domain-containing protein n=1 Tax=Streptomyces humicola TaxID=2953240 RepID=A0ABT1PP65_9ACTN|nr:transglycosylase SLT domain-containing protein [Streptomyces humicola]MCQ4079473.1 transglycosylase SLT domain-containing protein [Streptomyces humicola]
MARHARTRFTRKQRISAIAVVTAGAAALAFASLQEPSAVAQNAAKGVQHRQSASPATALDAMALPVNGATPEQANISRQLTAAVQRAQAQAQAEAQAQRRAEAAREARRRRREAAERAAELAAKQAAQRAEVARQAATPLPAPTPIAAAPVAAQAPVPAPSAAPVTYADNLDGWIEHALAIMQQNGIPGTYDGIYRNIMRESSGNPDAVNNWDSNAAAGTPSEGLLQVIQPTFDAYHVAGTSWNITDPVANIVAACNYAAHKYGSIDNVYSAY